MNQLTIVIGILVVNVLGLPEALGSERLWPILVGFMLVPGIVQIVGLLFAVESPKYLYVNRNLTAEAEQALIKLRGEQNRELIDSELRQLKREKEKQQAEAKEIAWSELFRVRHLVRPLMLASFIQFAQQLSGINAVIFYSTSIFKSVGLKDSWPIYATILLNFIQLIMTVVCMFVIDRAGRRVLLILGLIGMCFSSYLLAIARILAVNLSLSSYYYFLIEFSSKFRNVNK